MKSKITKIIGLVGIAAAALSAGTAFAAWSNQASISSIEYGPTTYLSFTATPSGRPACGTLNAHPLVGTPDAVKAMTAGATAAFLAGRPVKVNWDGTCEGQWARISHIQVF